MYTAFVGPRERITKKSRMTFYHVLAILAVLYGAYQVLFTGNTVIGLVGLGLAALLLWIAPRRR